MAPKNFQPERVETSSRGIQVLSAASIFNSYKIIFRLNVVEPNYRKSPRPISWEENITSTLHDFKRGKTRVTPISLHLTGWEIGGSLLDQYQSQESKTNAN